MSYVIGVRLKMMDIFGICPHAPQHHFNPGMIDYFWFYGLSALRNFSKSVQVIISRWCNKNLLTMLLHRFLFCSCSSGHILYTATSQECFMLTSLKWELNRDWRSHYKLGSAMIHSWHREKNVWTRVLRQTNCGSNL